MALRRLKMAPISDLDGQPAAEEDIFVRGDLTHFVLSESLFQLNSLSFFLSFEQLCLLPFWQPKPFELIELSCFDSGETI